MSEQDVPKKHPKPTSYDQLYPGRFVKAAELLGKRVTVTMSDVELEDLEGDDGKKTKCIISFKETPKKLVACKTNGLCVKEMFGKVLADWIGKRITLFEDTWNGEPCIRIWGSPDIPGDIEVTISLPRRRPFKKTLHRMGVKSSSSRASMEMSDEEAAAALAAMEPPKDEGGSF